MVKRSDDDITWSIDPVTSCMLRSSLFVACHIIGRLVQWPTLLATGCHETRHSRPRIERIRVGTPAGGPAPGIGRKRVEGTLSSSENLNIFAAFMTEE